MQVVWQDNPRIDIERMDFLYLLKTIMEQNYGRFISEYGDSSVADHGKEESTTFNISSMLVGHTLFVGFAALHPLYNCYYYDCYYSTGDSFLAGFASLHPPYYSTTLR